MEKLVLSDEQIFQEICHNNGIEGPSKGLPNDDQLANVSHLEIFFNGFTKISQLNRFQNLKTLEIFSQELTQISGIESCTFLNELWICECLIEKISGLNYCKNLKKLYLYTNQIAKIENLNDLNLEVLWLNDNKIKTIENLSHMRNLKELNLAKNLITKIDNSLIALKSLENVNLSGNLIYSFDDLLNLQSLPYLRIVSFKDPQYGSCPITSLCNYSVFMIYHLPELNILDTVVINQKPLKEITDATINKKKLWYNMKLNTLKRELQEINEKLKQFNRLQLKSHYIERIFSICKLKDFEQSIDLDQALSDEELKSKIDKIKNEIENINKKFQQNDKNLKEQSKEIEQKNQIEKSFILLELENVGNIKFENGKQDDHWFKSCNDLILSRFCASDYILRMISGIKIHKIMRVTNRLLSSQFEEALFNYIDENDYINNKASVRKKMDYLMYSWRPRLGNQIDELFDIIKYGFKDTNEYKKINLENGIPFSNSLSVSELLRIESFSRANDSYKYLNCPYKHGFILLCKVFTHNFSKFEKADNSIENYSSESSISPDNYKEKNGVYRQFTTIKNPSNTSIEVTREFLDTQRSCDCKSKQNEYFLFDKHLALPEYIIEFEYISKNSENNSNSIELDIINVNDINKNVNLYDKVVTDNEINRNLANELLEKLKNDICYADSLENLNLHNCETLSGNIFDKFIHFRHLKKLILSFINLKEFPDVSQMSLLEHLDVSHNCLEEINTFKTTSNLLHLDLSYNRLIDLIRTLNDLKHIFPLLAHLNIIENPFIKTSGIRLVCLFYLKSLKTLNNNELKQFEMDNASIRLLSNEFIVNNSFNLLNRPRNLKYSFVTEYLKDSRSYKHNTLYNDQSIVPLNLTLLDTNWQFKVTSLCLDNQNLFKLNSLGSLVNLRWASFNDNYLTSIDGLECCTKIEEISLENNYLTSFSGLEDLRNLRKLNLSQNNIEIDYRNVDNISIHLPRLTYLSLNHNRIKNLKFIHKLPSLIELYVNFNELSNLREIYNLKQNTNLVILDIWCNPMCTDPKYRLFVIYHLKNLKALDGYPVEQVEYVEARELLGGKLTWDLIAEKCANLDLKNSLNLSENGLKVIDLTEYQLVPQQFLNLASLNLENNYLTSFSGLCYLRNLKCLCLNNNKIESLFPKLKSGSQASTQAIQEPQKILERLEILYLDFNGIGDLLPLQLGKLPSLTLLSLRGNELTKVEGLENSTSIRQLILDKNKIKTVTETSFIGLTNSLVELHIEENRIKDLNNFYNLKHIEQLYAANNKINDVNDIERLQYLTRLNILSLINNPISKKSNYRITIIDRLPKLKILDTFEVTDEERLKADMYFNEQYQLQLQQAQPQIVFNTLSNSSQTSNSTYPASLNHYSSDNNTNIFGSNLTTNNHTASPRVKPILFMDKFLAVGNTINTQKQQAKTKQTYDKLTKEFHAKFKGPF